MVERRIAIYTGNRAEFGMLCPIIKSISQHPKLECNLIVSGAHLDESYGLSKSEIEQEGLRIYKEIDLKYGSDDELSIVKSIGEGIIKISEALVEMRPDIVLVGADRYEGFSAMVASTQLNIPTAHFEGGDVTLGGALDDSLRHAMTKMAHLHFTTNKESMERVLRLGEEKHRVFNVGFPGNSDTDFDDMISPNKLAEELSIDLKKPLILFTQHSISTQPDSAIEQILPSLEALNELTTEKDIQVIITYPNNDAGGKKIISKIQEFSIHCNSKINVIPHLGHKRYHSLLNICGNIGLGVCVGNSSSGIKETPIFSCPSITIGTRQNGRLRAENVISVDYSKDQIKKAVIKSLFDNEYREFCKNVINPYGNTDAGLLISDILSRVSLDYEILNKKITY
jgi:UDP-N-acetylglucosamine 2-epimerase (non-hydrolysing)/GDP/UDP-N,N'-diacetylbacillosamine 2-epimerase (hydrolysing)